MIGKKKQHREWVARSQGELAALFDVSPSTVRDWRVLGMPGGSRSYDVGQVIRWLRTEGPWRVAPRLETDTNPLDEYRRARAEREKLALQRDRDEYVPVSDMQQVFTVIATCLRDAAETLQRLYGDGAADVHNDALAEAERQLNAVCDLESM